MQVFFVPHQLSILGYNRFFLRKKLRYKLAFVASTLIVLFGIYLAGTEFINDPIGWLNNLSSSDLLLRFFGSLRIFYLNLLTATPLLIFGYTGIVIGWLLSRMVVSAAFTVYRNQRRDIYYKFIKHDGQLPQGYAFKVPGGFFSLTFYLLILVSALALAPFALVIAPTQTSILAYIAAIGGSILFSFIDYSHVAIVFGEEKEIVYTAKTFGRLFERPKGESKAPTLKYEAGKKGLKTGDPTPVQTKCPKCGNLLPEDMSVVCKHCGFNLMNIICPICRENLTPTSDKGLCPHCSVMFHYSHLSTFVSVHNKCPNCHQRLSYRQIIRTSKSEPVQGH